jgi:hypothetical protein
MKNVAVVLGRSGLVGVDVDGDEGETLLAGLGVELPSTVTVRTGRGRHFWFRAPDGYTGPAKIELAEKVTLSSEGYFVAPPSVHPDGSTYVFDFGAAPWEIALAELPAALIERLTSAATNGHQNGDGASRRRTSSRVIPAGQRNNALISHAGRLRRAGLHEDEIEETLQVFNLSRCVPPLPVEEVAGIARSAERYREGGGGEQDEVDLSRWVPLSTVRMADVTWIDKPLWQASALQALAGRSGVGKGLVLADTAARFTRGEFGERRRVLLFSSEEAPDLDLHPRVVAAGGDASLVVLPPRERPLVLPDSVPFLRSVIEAFGDVGLVIFDPAASFMRGDGNKEEIVRPALDPLNALAADCSCLIVAVRHLSEKGGNREIRDLLTGSSAWRQVPRALLVVAEDDEQADVRHIQNDKNNRLPPGSRGRSYRIEGRLLRGMREETPRVVWLGDSAKDVGSLLSGREPSNSETARSLILDLLEAAPGLAIESDVLDAQIAKATGLSAGTVRNLRTRLKDAGLIKSRPEKDEDGNVLHWTVVRTAAPRP